MLFGEAKWAILEGVYGSLSRREGAISPKRAEAFKCPAEVSVSHTLGLGSFFWLTATPPSSVSAGQKVHQIGRFDDAPCTALSGIRHTSARPRVTAARCVRPGRAPASGHRATLRAVDRIVSRG